MLSQSPFLEYETGDTGTGEATPSPPGQSAGPHQPRTCHLCDSGIQCMCIKGKIWFTKDCFLSLEMSLQKHVRMLDGALSNLAQQKVTLPNGLELDNL